MHHRCCDHCDPVQRTHILTERSCYNLHPSIAYFCDATQNPKLHPFRDCARKLTRRFLAELGGPQKGPAAFSAPAQRPAWRSRAQGRLPQVRRCDAQAQHRFCNCVANSPEPQCVVDMRMPRGWCAKGFLVPLLHMPVEQRRKLRAHPIEAASAPDPELHPRWQHGVF